MKITNKKIFFFVQNIKQLVNDDGTNVKQFFSLTKLIVIYMDTLINKITDFGYTRTLT